MRKAAFVSIAGVFVLAPFFLLRQSFVKYWASSVHFIVLGDSGTGDQTQFTVSQAMKRVCGTVLCEAFFIVGDVIYPGGVSSIEDKQFQTKFEIPYKEFSQPFYIALGNHDVLGKCLRCYEEYSAVSQKWRFPDPVYKQTIGEFVDVYVINTEELNEEQVQNVLQERAQSKATWHVLAGHVPIISHDTTHGNAQGIQEKYLKELLCTTAAPFDVYIAGHAHNLEDAGDYCGVRLIISGGGGAQVRDVASGQSPFISSTNGFVLFSMSRMNMTIHFYDARAIELYSWIKRKAS